MPHFLVEYREIGDTASREAHRAEHIAYRKGLGAAMPLAGPILDDGGQPVGSLIILEADNAGDAATIAGQDPFVSNRIMELVSVRPYRIAALKPLTSGAPVIANVPG